MAEHKIVKAQDLKIGDVLCPYGEMHFHYPITDIKLWEKNRRVGISIEGTFQPCSYDTIWTIVTDDDSDDDSEKCGTSELLHPYPSDYDGRYSV